jgi:ATP-dependent exoDNAse (exonuclease V) alpha subunit
MRQKQALSVMMSGANVFLTGAPGAGKTYVLGQFVKRAERLGKKVAVTASTGIAASHLGGTTIHSWSGLGIIDNLAPEDLRRLGSSDRLAKRYNSTDILVIDEVSMLHGARLDMVNQLAKLLRSSEAPFGGLQVVLVGDLFQLPPISRGTDLADFVHLSQAWAELEPRICYLTEQHRQSSTDALLDLLTAMRSGQVNEMHETMLSDRLERQPPEAGSVTRLFSHNIDVDAINQRHLTALSTPTKTFAMQTKGSRAKIEQLAKGVLAPEELELKVGAEVMFVANNFGSGFVNGSRGQVIDFKDGLPLVRLANDRIIKVEPHSWSLTEDGRVRAEVSQLPLRLAWAITIHKSQGMSLDAAEIDLSRAFTPGMGYVALSRVRSLAGLYLQGLNNMAMVMHPDIHDFDADLREHSTQLAITTTDIADEATKSSPSMQSPVADDLEFDQVLFDKLKHWRLQRARADQVAPFIIAHNTHLIAIAAKPPATTQQLLGLPGFGVSKVEKYGSAILTIVAAHTQSK